MGKCFKCNQEYAPKNNFDILCPKCVTEISKSLLKRREFLKTIQEQHSELETRKTYKNLPRGELLNE